ncbi:MAG: photosynthetic reaction center subunit M, partial [Sphingomonas sp.]
MASYQNIFTQVQLRGVPEAGIPLPREDGPRTAAGGFNYWIGKLGNAQIGPIYLGKLGVAALVCGFIAFEIIGLNMWASVGWNPIQFVRQLPWLALEPPGPEWGFSPFVPLAKGGWWILAGAFLTASILLWWVRIYTRARALNMGTHVAWAFASAI